MCASVCLHATIKKQARSRYFQEHVCKARAIGLRQVQVACLSLYKIRRNASVKAVVVRLYLTPDHHLQCTQACKSYIYMYMPECSRSPGTHQDIWHLDCNVVYKSTVPIASKMSLNSHSSLPAASNLIHDHHMYMVASAVSIS